MDACKFLEYRIRIGHAIKKWKFFFFKQKTAIFFRPLKLTQKSKNWIGQLEKNFLKTYPMHTTSCYFWKWFQNFSYIFSGWFFNRWSKNHEFLIMLSKTSNFQYFCPKFWLKPMLSLVNGCTNLHVPMFILGSSIGKRNCPKQAYVSRSTNSWTLEVSGSFLKAEP